MEELRLAQIAIREETRNLLRESTYMPMKAMILPCQKKCLNLYESSISETERTCLQSCMDKMAFLDNATFELDSASTMAAQQGKPKKAFVYFNRRIEDLTTLLD
mmetsp:Transcript_24640/g.30720  ORF Transcript_24640/g.30720 Transcript_24640/m.30720 type:complete len:104 (-) Transcript_24640:102-413(-)